MRVLASSDGYAAMLPFPLRCYLLSDTVQVLLWVSGNSFAQFVLHCVQVAALCIFADVINFGGTAAAKEYSKVYLPAAILAVCPQDDSLPVEDKLSAIAAAAYGIGMLAPWHWDLVARISM